MLTRDTQQGTTLEILAPYLPYGIEVEWEGGGKKKRATVRGIDNVFRHARHRLVPVVHLVHGDQPAGALSPEWCLPVLRPFSALVTPLEDGTVPARRIAEMALEVPDWLDQPELNWDKLTAIVDEDDQGLEHLIVTVPEVARLAQPVMLYMWTDGTVHVHNGPHGNQLAIFDQLRAWHFALPVNGRPLVEGVDYIAKDAPAAASPTLEKGTAS